MQTLKVRKLDIELEKRRIRWDIIKGCIYKSKHISLALAAKQALRNSKFFMARCSFVLHDSKIDELIEELDSKIHTAKRHIAIALNQLSMEYPNMRQYDLFWFSIADLRNGYILLTPHASVSYASHVLFLVPVVDNFDGQTYFPGDIKPYRQVNHVLPSVKGFADIDLGIGFNYATKADMLNELSTLSSIIKSKNHERTK